MPGIFQHSVFLDVDKCKGCTTCLKRCPTEAIRIREGHAVINSEVCIDCGECIKVCPYKAKSANFDKIEDIPADKKYRIALPPPSLFGQFPEAEDVDVIIQALLDCGFDEVFEVARAAELVSAYTRNYMRKENVPRPVISSACPTIVRLIRLRFPYLCSHVMPMLPPLEVASKMAKAEAIKKHPELREDEICTCFISPCPAKVSYIKNGIWKTKSTIDYALSMSDIYFKILPQLKKQDHLDRGSETGMIGLSWASTGGESSALLNDKYLAADGIENVIRVLDEIETGHFPNLEFVELNACNGGCVGGAAAVENPYIARVRLQTLRRFLPVSRNRIDPSVSQTDYVPLDLLYPTQLSYRPVEKLDEDMGRAMLKMQAIDDLCESLPALDCGSCGAPNCRAFAQDVIQGTRSLNECIVRMREHMKPFIESFDAANVPESVQQFLVKSDHAEDKQ